MPCPFGFTADEGEAADDERMESSEGEGDDKQSEKRLTGSDTEDDGKEDAGGKHARAKAKAKPAQSKEERRKAKAKLQADAAEEFDYDKDPVKWFYANQIKSEAEFAQKKDTLRAQARQRLDNIMASKNKLVEWDSDMESLSIRSSELSDWNSDVDSLSSLISCADSWIEDARYSTPAETALKWTAGAGLVTTMYCLYISLQATKLTRQVSGVVANSWWPFGSFVASALLGTSLLVLIMAAMYRKRRMLLAGQVCALVIYSAYLVLTCAVLFAPTAVDPQLRESACTRYGKTDNGAKLCKMLPSIAQALRGHMATLLYANAVGACLSLAALGTSVWYVFELGYIEKKAIKHKRRHKRRKHTIPWHKIKIVGPVTNCTGGGGGGGGKCPIGMGGGAKAGAASKCPMAGFGVGAKKNN